jgi:PIN domain nuclease of toxin-antitoxin system
MSGVVLDASAVLALVLREAGAEQVQRYCPGATISAVNVAEVVARLAEGGTVETDVRAAISELGFSVVPLDAEQAFATGMLRPKTRHAGLSLGDRACLALARERNLPALTADRRWRGLDVGVDIRFIRPT